MSDTEFPYLARLGAVFDTTRPDQIPAPVPAHAMVRQTQLPVLRVPEIAGRAGPPSIGFTTGSDQIRAPLSTHTLVRLAD